MKNIKEKIIEILRDVIFALDNRDWDREAHVIKQELKIMRENNDNDFEMIIDQILELFSLQKQEIEIEQRRRYTEIIHKDCQKFIDALIWCSGSDNFQVGGKARKGWEKICLPLLKKRIM